MPDASPIPKTHPRDPERTQARLLAAAREEFAEFGLAGARVDRIAERSGSNKRLLYAYFGNKGDVFAAVVADCVIELNAAAPFEPDDLAGYAGRVFDYLDQHGTVRRVLHWRDVESARPTRVETDSYRRKLHAVAQAQAAGRLNDQFDPIDLLALIEAIISSWLNATVGLRGAAGRSSARRRSQHKDAVVRAAHLITRPEMTITQ